MISNNTCISRVFSKRIAQKYDNIFLKSFCTLVRSRSIEEGEFAEAREDLGFLEKDYLYVLSEQPTDDVGGNNAGDDADDAGDITWPKSGSWISFFKLIFSNKVFNEIFLQYLKSAFSISQKILTFGKQKKTNSSEK
ncbi:alpha-1 tubulin [Reticulomyxa filosa]|uniref:Alpha-1 tubulin n=1 Tax=Reticulomyxa filosa TaxID=46433 RepID=X6M9H3_RETFI|nr:alpha-1 tubulin [Reticulomyxa filosa]|eukprot:ETO09665.1 alpha-1 tubulin [Reticulomyxa filosa]